MYCHTENEVQDQTYYLTQAAYTDTRPTSPSADPKTSGAWQGSYWSTNFQVTGITKKKKKKKGFTVNAKIKPGSAALEVDTLLLPQRDSGCVHMCVCVCVCVCV